MSPGFVPPVPFITQQPHHFMNANPPRPTLLPAQPITENSWWLNCSFGDEDFDDLSLPSDFSLAIQEQITKNVLNQFVSSTTYTDFP